MKKFLTAILCLFLFMSTCKCANALDLNARHDIFTPAFQLIWNDFSDKFANGHVNFVGWDPITAKVLNASTFKSDDVSENSYYKIVAPKSLELRAKIQRQIFEKFGETSKILDDIDWNKISKDEYILYAMLKKNVEFPHEFQILKSAPFNGSKEKVKYFGVTKDSSKYSDEIKPLFYTSKNNFAVSLTTKEGDRVVLYRTNSKQNVFDLYKEVTLQSKKMLKFGESDKLYVPFISVNEKISYDMLCGKKIVKSRYIIAKALEYVEFNLDNKGAKLKNEAVMDVVKMSMPIPGREVIYDFNKQFIVYMIEKDKNTPYFALRIDNTRFLVK